MKRWVPLLALGIALTPLAVLHPVRIQGRSMEPTLKSGHLGWVLRRWAAGSPLRGQVWLVDTPDGPSLKRVLALPGEDLEMRNGELRRSGQHLAEDYVQHAERDITAAWSAGSGYLVLGDNRPASRDSRSWGALPPQAFRGRLL